MRNFTIKEMVVAYNKTTEQGLLVFKLKSSLCQFYGRHHDLLNRYSIYLSQITTDMFRLSKSQFVPYLIHDISPAL